MEQKDIALTILGVVAIIAIVGLVLLFVQKPEEERAGEAFKIASSMDISSGKTGRTSTCTSHPAGYRCPIGCNQVPSMQGTVCCC